MASETTVIHVRDMQPGDIYIGRPMPRQRLAGSRWSNPYRVTRDQPRETAIRLYRLYVTDRPDLMAALETLRGKRLACWSSSGSCSRSSTISSIRDSGMRPRRAARIVQGFASCIAR